MEMELENSPFCWPSEDNERNDYSCGYDGGYGEEQPKKRHKSGDCGVSSSSRGWRGTGLSDIPSPILSTIFSLVSDVRSRNAMSLVCTEWCQSERASRRELCLRGNVCDLHLLPASFRALERLDISNCSPWGCSIFQSQEIVGELAGHWLRQAFPNVLELTVYVRDAIDIQMVVWVWPGLETLRLVRWHQRPVQPEAAAEVGMELHCLIKSCFRLRHLDLSKFYCWTEDIPPALEPGGGALNLCSLNLLKLSPEGFKGGELAAISSACRNLEELYVLCEFDPRFLDCVNDDCLAELAANCSGLRILHLVDSTQFGGMQENPEDAGLASEDARISTQGLESMFQALPRLEDLALVLGQNVRDSAPAFEALARHCRHIRSIRLSHFHGVCLGPEIDGIARCLALQELFLKSSCDLWDKSLGTIARGCSRLGSLGLRCCKLITEAGLEDCVAMLKRSLVHVEIECCHLLSTAEVLRALTPARASLQYLHVDCVWSQEEVAGTGGAAPEPLEEARRAYSAGQVLETSNFRDRIGGCSGSSQLLRSGRLRSFSENLGLFDAAAAGAAGGCYEPAWSDQNSCSADNCWKRLHHLSLWISAAQVVSPLPLLGLEACPALEKLSIRVEGDCRLFSKPCAREWGLSSFHRFPALKSLKLDLSGAVGYALSAPGGNRDLSIWERFYLKGIQSLQLSELDYFPPSDKDVNHRGITLPGLGLLSECSTLRKLFVHGTAYEHLFMMLLNIANLRDVQLRADYYPTPETEMCTEMRAESCRRFENILAKRGFPD